MLRLLKKTGTCSLVLVIMLAMLIACGDKGLDYTHLEGKWDLYEAKRNGRPTQTLDNVYFQFDGKEVMQTNILGGDDRFDYEIKESELVIESSQMPLIRVLQWQTDTLKFQMDIGSFIYDMAFERKSSVPSQ